MNQTRQAGSSRQKPVVLIVESNSETRNFYSQMRSHFVLSPAVNTEVARSYFTHHQAEVEAIVISVAGSDDPSAALTLISWIRERGYRKLIIGASYDSINRRRFRDEVDCTVVDAPDEVFSILRSYLPSEAVRAPRPHVRESLRASAPPA